MAMVMSDEFGIPVYEGVQVVHVSSSSNNLSFKRGVVLSIEDDGIIVEWDESSKPYSWSLPSKPTKIRKNFVVV